MKRTLTFILVFPTVFLGVVIFHLMQTTRAFHALVGTGQGAPGLAHDSSQHDKTIRQQARSVWAPETAGLRGKGRWRRQGSPIPVDILDTPLTQEPGSSERSDHNEVTERAGEQRVVEPTGDRGGCETPCARAYLDAMSHVSAKAYRNVAAALCGPHLEGRKVWKTDFPMLVGAGQGSSGTRALSSMTAVLGLSTFHFDTTTWPIEFPNIKAARSGPPLLNLSFTMIAVRDRQDDWHIESGLMDFRAMRSVDAIFDTPFPEFLTETLETYPNASVVLTVRDPRAWRKSRLKQDNPRMPYPHPCGDYVYDNTEEQVTRAYEATNDYVRCVIPEDRLAELNHVTDTDEAIWRKLVRLLERRGKISPHAHRFAGNCAVPRYLTREFACALADGEATASRDGES